MTDPPRRPTRWQPRARARDINGLLRGPVPDRFYAVMARWQSWVFSGRRLRAAADGLADLSERDVRRLFTGVDPNELRFADTVLVAMMLAGLALENLAKGLVVKRERIQASQGALPGFLLRHGIEAFLRRGRFRLTADESHLVGRLEGFIMWAGRYPVPRRAGDFRHGRRVLPDDLRRFRQLYDRLEAAVLDELEET